MTEANGWASDVICAFRQGILTASELWDVLVSHMDEKDAGENVARVLGQFQALTSGAVHFPVAERQMAGADDVVVLEDES